MRKSIFLFFLVIILNSLPSTGAEKLRIAVMDLNAKGVPLKIAENVSELVRGELISIGRYTVIERSQMGAILKEQGLQQTGCTDDSCAVEVGNLLSARKMLVGTVMKLGEKIIISGRIVDIEKGVGEFSEREIAASEADLDRAVSLFARKLSVRILGGKMSDYEVKPAFENPYTLPTFGFGGLSLAAIGGGLFFNSRLSSINSDYDSLYDRYKATSDPAEATNLHSDMTAKTDEADKAALYRNISYGVGALSLGITGYFAYRYFTHPSSMDGVKSSKGEDLLFMPLAAFSINRDSSRSVEGNGYFFGAVMMYRF